jgi:hypothetical protein
MLGLAPDHLFCAPVLECLMTLLDLIFFDNPTKQSVVDLFLGSFGAKHIVWKVIWGTPPKRAPGYTIARDLPPCFRKRIGAGSSSTHFGESARLCFLKQGTPTCKTRLMNNYSMIAFTFYRVLRSCYKFVAVIAIMSFNCDHAGEVNDIAIMLYFSSP